MALAHSDPPHKISIRYFLLFPKIREIYVLITLELVARIFEVRPELAIWSLTGKRAISLPNKTKSRLNARGLDDRRRLLNFLKFQKTF